MTKRRLGVMTGVCALAAVILIITFGRSRHIVWRGAPGTHGSAVRVNAPVPTPGGAVSQPRSLAEPAGAPKTTPSDSKGLTPLGSAASIPQVEPVSFIRDKHGILTIRPRALTGPPEVTVLPKPKVGAFFVRASMGYILEEGEDAELLSNQGCDIDPTVSGARDIYDNGVEVYRVARVNPDGTFVLDMVKKTPRVAMVKKRIITFQKFSGKLEVTVAPNQEVKETRIDGKRAAEGAAATTGIVPQLKLPSTPLRPGMKWEVVTPGPGGKKNKIHAEVFGFAQVLGHKCIAIRVDQVTNLRGTRSGRGEEVLRGPAVPQEWETVVTTRGYQYFDYETGIPVREDYVHLYETQARPLGTTQPFRKSNLHPPNGRTVMQLLGDDEARQYIPQ